MRHLLVIALLAGCGAPLQNVQITNRTNRTIEQLYVYPQGAADHGASRATLAPNGSVQVQVKPGFVEVYAVSAKLQVDEHTRDRPSASQDIEIRGPAEVVFYDLDQKPTGLERPGVFGVAFTLPKPKPAPAPAPEPEAAP
jgi:hypothetical protein